jgi:hypothetical protein
MEEWRTVFQTELDLNDAIDDAQVTVTEVDERLNQFADRSSKEVLLITRGNRADPL